MMINFGRGGINMKLVLICLKKALFVAIFLIGFCIAIHGYALLPAGRVICDFTREIYEGGIYLLAGLAVMGIGACRWLLQKESLLIVGALVLTGFIYFLVERFY